MEDRPRLLILGLDGADPALLFGWAREGRLPHVARLMGVGAWGPLTSTFPPMTLPAWSTFLTGVNPGRHGIFDFVARRPGGYRVEFVNSTFRTSPTVFRLLSDAGRRVASLGVPTTYPPEPVNGVMVGGFDSPVATGIDPSFCHPRSFFREIREVIGAFRFADFQELEIGEGWHRAARERLLDTASRKERLGLHLAGRELWDCMMVLFGESDTAGHHFWWLMDPASPRHDPELARELGDTVLDVYRRLDEAVGALWATGAFTHVLLASDHGFGGAGDRVLYLNRWLEREGFLAFRGGASPAGHGVGSRPSAGGLAKGVVLRALPHRLHEVAFRRAPAWLRSRVETSSRYGALDLPRTQVFSDEMNYAPSLWIHTRGRDPLGTVEPGAARERLVERLTRRLLAWRDPVDGGPVVERVHRREDLFHGPMGGRAADLYLELRLPGGYTYTCLPSRGPGEPLRTIASGERRGGKGRGMNGSHRRDGIWLLAGPGVRPMPDRRADIADMAPTALRLLGVSGLEGADGRVLEEVLGSAAPPPPRPAVPAPAIPASYGAEEERAMEARLRALGYFE